MMKKIFTALLAAVLALSLAVTGLAAGNALSVSAGEVRPGGTVYLTVELLEPIQGDAMELRYSYDPKLLTPLPGSCTWVPKGELRSFGAGDSGIWTGSSAVSLQGPVCTLAFQAKTGAAVSSTAVECTLTVKNGSAEAGQYTAKGQVLFQCSHSYRSAWRDEGETGHSRACALCGEEQAASHSWSQGVASENTGKQEGILYTYTCTDCGRQRQVLLPGGSSGTTAPVVKPNETPVITVPTTPSQSVEPEAAFESTGAPAPEEPASGGYEEESALSKPALVLGTVLVLAVLAAGGVWLCRRQKKEAPHVGD